MLYPYKDNAVHTANDILSRKGKDDGDKHIKQILYFCAGFGELEEFWTHVQQHFNNAINNNPSC